LPEQVQSNVIITVEPTTPSPTPATAVKETPKLGLPSTPKTSKYATGAG